MRSQGRASTDKAARYMTQLAKHWSHRFDVRYDERTAHIPLPAGPCDLRAEPDALVISLVADDEEGLARMETVVADHLARFAFREPELKIEWRRIEGLPTER